MPLSRNVYGMSQTDVYRNVDREDPKAILNGVAITGLVGILRQLGDLAEFAAEIFHGIQEEIMATASRSNQLKIRLQHIEATVPPLEKAMLAQTTHIHFAYTGGLEWHPRIPITQNHLIYDDLPHMIMDSYEECKDPPRLHWLDKFDINGPGSCLKRYSDPTYFRRASSNLIQGNKKLQKDKKHCKLKKKSSSRSRDMSRLASIANQNARKTFTSFSFSGQTSSSKTTSTSDMEKTSDFQDHHSRSFESRTGSGYIECLSTATSSLKTGERSKGVFVSSSLTPRSCTIASVISECETEDAYDNSQFSPSQGQAAHGSSCVSWDEKAEILESLGLQTDEVSEKMETSSVVDALEEKTSCREGTGRVDFHSKDLGNDKSESRLQNRTRMDEVREIKTGQVVVGELRDTEHETESEGDCFVDALNTIESEPENDLRLHTRQEVVRSSCGVVDERLEKSVCEQEIEHTSNSVKDFCRTDGFVDYGLKNEENASLENASDKRNRQDPQVWSDVNCFQQNDLCAKKDNKRDNSGGEDSITFTYVPGLENSLADSSNPLIHHGLQENQESEAETSSDIEAIRIWTNGGLLGLKPSKPPVLAVSSSFSPDCNTKEAEKDKSDDLVENASHRNVLNKSSLATPGTQDQNCSDGKGTSVVDQRECDEIFSGVFGLSHKLLTNSFRRKDSFALDRKTVPATIPENDEVNTEKMRFCDQDFNEKTLMDPFRDEAPIDWSTSSPPLQHMKISLSPADTLQASRLKLKFSDGDSNYNTFSSFQLLPEAATFLPDSYSDDDTFCRSSPYMSDSDDYRSDNHSVSNSEQWEESSDSHERKEQELYDSFHEIRHVDNNAEVSPLAMISESGTNALNLSYLQNPAEPLPPPFPPVQWMVSKTPSDKSEDKTQPLQLQDALRFAFEKHISLPTVNKEQPSMVTSAPKPEIKVHLKNNVREGKQSDNAKETETGDFLQQIRTQQFNLRPVVMTTTSSAPTTTDPIINTKISAILEKANSIRQAVASKDGDESDTWSDT
ncbi:PREDICTED: protein SCAR3-like isoform X2 [Camelina sativa]|uniref:Protein SCAR n=1 Tax=Camelina sativa TaxID=90675 RepID=A0ABM0VT19_CAMSA|nr:PREDICTED: protein SCAR3-like isoform X1 [Camelina sativa]XP_019091971.1 PREDICTED: protein SCAR3-like isoform X2 [Camelina sativa]